MDKIHLTFDGDINKFKEQISKLPPEQQEALKDVIDTLPIRIGLSKILHAVTESMFKMFSMEELVKVPAFTLITLIQPLLVSTNVDEIIIEALQRTGTIDKIFEMMEIVRNAQEESLRDYKDKQGSPIEDVLKQYLKNNQN